MRLERRWITSKLPNPVFFTDRDLSAATFVDILRGAHLTVERHDDHFPQVNVSDEEWLHKVGQEGWIALSHDTRIRYRNNERDAVFLAGACLFILEGKATFPELAENFVMCLPKLEQFLKKHPPPFIAKIYRPSSEEIRKGSRKSGRVELWLSYDQWREKVEGR